MNNLISIVIPNYNSALYINQTLDSVLKQTYKYFEIIVVDDKSSDNSISLIEDYIKENPNINIKLICLNDNYGMPAGPRNIGVESANGSWIAFLDCDDIWHPLKLELQMKALIDNNCSFCSSKMMNFKHSNEIVFDEIFNLKINRINFQKQLLKNRTPTSSIVVKRDLMLKFKFNESKEYFSAEDFDCWLKIHENIKNSIKINNTLLFYRIADGQISGNKFRMFLKNYMVLKNYRFNNGEKFGFIRYYYLITQALLAFYYRAIKKTL